MWPFGRKGPNQFTMTETMWGHVAPGASSFEKGYEDGKDQDNKLEYEVTLHVDNFKEFKAPSGRKAKMTGWVSCKRLFGERLPIENGEYGLYVIDSRTGQRRITYRFDFTDARGEKYQFSGYKVIVHERSTLDLLDDQTTLFAVIKKMSDPDDSEFARGIIHYHVEDFPEMVLSLRTPPDDTIANRLEMARKFFAFVSKEIGEYFSEISPLYTAEYTNLVCSGTAKANGGDVDFFLFSGVHDRGFPWGDNVSFSDIGLVLRSKGTWRRFATTERAIDELRLRLTEGTYHYQGPLYEITDGYQVSFKDIHQPTLPKHLRKVDAKITLRFRPKRIEKRSIPFDLDRNRMGILPKDLRKRLEKSAFFKDLQSRRWGSEQIGYTTEIHRLADIEGEIVIAGAGYPVVPGNTLGEGEFGKLTGFRKPTLYYNYFCAIEPQKDVFRVQIRSGVLRTLTTDPLVTESENIIGELIGQMSRMDLLIRGGAAEDILAEEAERLIAPQEDLLEIDNDHFPTATFQRRIVIMPGAVGERALALEEDMSAIDPEPIGSSEEATVAAIKDPDRFKALDRVLEVTGFFGLLEKAQRDSGKSKEKFSIIIKPNFSFMYSLKDISTFTDPNLVEHLIDRIHDQGYRNIAVAEAQSTYTVFVTNRDVPTLARYIGLRGKNYKVIDLSENTEPYDYGGTLGKHEVHPAWRDADFRISFAKNKTHSYAYYTLTIKNIYGALPRKNKFKHYHCNKDLGIFAPTIDFIAAFPIHFGLIDAYFSADGPFGIFADVEPNFTSTVIGGDNIVAVDWVGASKMGYDPMVSEYMNLAVGRFGKPKIDIVGDHSMYPGWRNVPKIVSQAAFSIMDRNFLFGDFLYSAMTTMDPFFKYTPNEVGRRIARLFTQPVRRVLFEWVRGDPERLTWKHLQQMLEPEQLEYMKQLVQSLFE